MATIKETNSYHSKEVVIDSDGDLVIWRGDVERRSVPIPSAPHSSTAR